MWNSPRISSKLFKILIIYKLFCLIRYFFIIIKLKCFMGFIEQYLYFIARLSTYIFYIVGGIIIELLIILHNNTNNGKLFLKSIKITLVLTFIVQFFHSILFVYTSSESNVITYLVIYIFLTSLP